MATISQPFLSLETTGWKRRVIRRRRAILQAQVFINRGQCFEGIAPQTWEFYIAGYRPAQKWLKDRKNRVLTFNDITHYRRLCAALAEIIAALMARIDNQIESHGGWPLS